MEDFGIWKGSAASQNIVGSWEISSAVNLLLVPSNYYYCFSSFYYAMRIYCGPLTSLTQCSEQDTRSFSSVQPLVELLSDVSDSVPFSATSNEKFAS